MSANDVTGFLETHVGVIEPLLRKTNLAYWRASISGKTSDFERLAELQLELQKVYSDPEEFDKVRRWKDDPRITHPLERRQLVLLYNEFLRNQIDPALNKQITELATRIENRFTIYRPSLNGRTLSSNDILAVLKESNDPVLRRKTWEAGKEVGTVVHKDLLRLVELRNEAAESLGYDNFYSMSLDLDEQNETEIVGLFRELDRRTRAPFESTKQDLDERVAQRYGIDPADLRPWHYDDLYFQEAPDVFDVDLDEFYRDEDIVDLASRFFRSIELSPDDILERSDLYEREGKDQHAYCTDIDRNGDIRVLANIKNGEMWAGTMLHELGHAVYDKHIDGALPFLLRREAHILATEAVAMMFGRFTKDANWIRGAVGMTHEQMDGVNDRLSRHLRVAQLIFARWAQVMVNFERALYTRPDQDLNGLWWDLVERFQRIQRPEDRDSPDWAAKTHMVSAPVYYHNYLLGELLASQLTHHIRTTIVAPCGGDQSFWEHPEIGVYLKERIFAPGATYRWNVLIEKATGEPLTPDYFVEEFVDS